MKWYFISTFRFIYIYLLHFVFLLLFLFFLLFGFLRPCYLFGWMLIFFFARDFISLFKHLYAFSFFYLSVFRSTFHYWSVSHSKFIWLCFFCLLLLLCFVTFFLYNLCYITGYLYAFLNFVFNDQKCLSLCYYCYYFSFFLHSFRLGACMCPFVYL